MRMIDADSLESKLPAHSNDSNHVMTAILLLKVSGRLSKQNPP